MSFRRNQAFTSFVSSSVFLVNAFLSLAVFFWCCSKRRSLYLLVGTFRPSYYISPRTIRKSISSVRLTWDEDILNMTVKNDDEDRWEKRRNKKEMLLLWIQDLKVSGSYSINIKHMQSLKGKSKSTYSHKTPNQSLHSSRLDSIKENLSKAPLL